MHNLIISGTETLITKTDRDVKRFQKLINKRPMPLSLLCICEADKWNFQVVEGDGYEEISVAEISYMDSAGITHVVSSSGGDLYVIRIFIQVDGKVLVVYQEKKDESPKYCSWGYKNSSATTEKLSVFFKTTDITWFVYLDAQHPEYTIFLDAETEEGWDCIQNVYNLIKILAVEKDEKHEVIL